jgi:hypothetical protein
VKLTTPCSVEVKDKWMYNAISSYTFMVCKRIVYNTIMDWQRIPNEKNSKIYLKKK